VSEILLQTKLYIPPLPRTLVSRPRLIRKLNEAVQAKLILISAPAGFGKTSLITDWLSEMAGEGTSLARERCAWVSLDEGDNDPPRFLAYCMRALQRVQQGIGEAAISDLLSPKPPSPDSLLASLLNEIAQLSAPTMLVLDDFHLITEPAVHETVVFLLDNMPPPMRLIISSRADPPWPLARLRAGRMMTELRSADLRFTAEETASFLNDAMRLDLTPDQVAVLDQRVEGWIAGLQLVALSMRGQEDVSGFITAFTGSHRYILDYLVEEVLDRQPLAVQQFLLKTSILDRLTASLCDAVVGGENGQATLTQLDRANLFLIPLDDERRWYRYHHLFSDLLRNHLGQDHSEQLPDLRQRAVAWYEKQGLLAEAVSQAQAAGNVDQVIGLIERNALAMAFHGELRPLLKWLDALPDETIRDRPWLSLAYAWVLGFAGQLDDVEPYLEQAENALSRLTAADGSIETQVNIDAIRGHILVARAFVTISLEDLDPGIELARRALDTLPEEELILRSLAAMMLGVALRLMGDLQESAQFLAKGLSFSRAAGDDHLAVTVLWETAVLEYTQGKLHRSFKTCLDALRLGQAYARRSGRQLRVSGYTLERMGGIMLEWNDLETAGRTVEGALRLAQQWGQADVIYEVYITQAKILRTTGALDEALEAIHHAKGISGGLSSWYALTASVQTALVHLAQGKADAAEHWLKNSNMSADDVVGPMYTSLYRDFARVLIALDRLPEALSLLTHLHQVAESSGMICVLIGTLSTQAVALNASGQWDQAMSALERALALAEPEGYVRAFVDEGEAIKPLLREAAARGAHGTYVSNLLAAFPTVAEVETESAGPGLRPPTPASPSLVEQLTDRELQVLRLLTSPLSSAEIADELFVAPSTIRSHIKSIYGKLNVHKRIEAVQRAQDLGLL
jgi:LuxR family maltose regulon positive regulatory protein